MAKRGENIRKRKDGRWEGRYIKGRKSDRTAIWGYIYGHSYTEVKEKLAIKKMEVQQFALNVENPTFSELSLTWESSIFLGVKSSTSAHYHYTLQHYILPVLGPYRVQALNESILESSLLEIIAPADQNHKTLGNAMSKECLTLVRRICRYAVHLHIMRPVEIDLKLPTVNPSNTSVLNNMEQKSVCAFVRSSPTPRRLGMLLMMQMGLRIGEVCGLQWGDFDLQNGVLSVRRTVKRIYMEPGKTTLVTQSPKTQGRTRKDFFHDDGTARGWFSVCRNTVCDRLQQAGRCRRRFRNASDIECVEICSGRWFLDCSASVWYRAEDQDLLQHQGCG